MYTKNAKFVPTNGSFKAHLDAENLYAKKSLNTKQTKTSAVISIRKEVQYVSLFTK